MKRVEGNKEERDEETNMYRKGRRRYRKEKIRWKRER